MIAEALAFSTASGRSEHGSHKPQSMIASFPDFDLCCQSLPSIPTTETAEFRPHKIHFETISSISRVATLAEHDHVARKSSGSGPDVPRKSYFNCSLPVRLISKSFNQLSIIGGTTAYLFGMGKTVYSILAMLDAVLARTNAQPVIRLNWRDAWQSEF